MPRQPTLVSRFILSQIAQADLGPVAGDRFLARWKAIDVSEHVNDR
jgi:hypothetical protein